jgi:hypothetical protein
MEMNSRLQFLLMQTPSEEVWGEICAELNTVEDANCLQGLIPQIDDRLARWPDGLRVGEIGWVERGEWNKLAIARVIPFFPEWGAHDAFSQEMDHQTRDSEIFKEYENFGLTSKPSHLHYDYDRDWLIMVEGSWNPDTAESEQDCNYDFVFRLDFQGQKAERLCALPRSLDVRSSYCDLIHVCEDGSIVVTIDHKRKAHDGEIHVLVLKEHQVLLHFKTEAVYRREWELPEAAEQAFFRISGDGQVVWGYYYPGNLVRIDLPTLTSQVLAGVSSQIQDMQPMESGILALRYNDDWFTIGPDHFERTPLPSATILTGMSFLSFSPINSVLLRHGLEVPSGTLSSFAFWRLNLLNHSLSLEQYLHVIYQRALDEAPFFYYRSARIGDAWRVAFLAPPTFSSLEVWEFPSGLSAQLPLTEEWLSPHAFGFDSTGTEIVFQAVAQPMRWRFQLSKREGVSSL